MKKSIHHIITVFLLAVCLQACNQSDDAMPDLRETFGYNDARPFGASVAFDMVKNAYPKKSIEFSKQEFADNYGWDYDTASLYFDISLNYYVNDRDAQSLLDFVYKGNTAFIASDKLDTALLHKIYCEQATQYSFYNKSEMRNTFAYIIPELSPSKDSFQYFYRPFNKYYAAINGDYGRYLGRNDADSTNLFVFFWGKGRFYFHSDPRAFSNYFLLTNNNYKYFEEVLQMIPEPTQNIYWDNFYGKRNHASNAKARSGSGGKNDSGKGSSIGTLMKYPPLAKAFLISLGLLLLYMLFNSKRRQRIVPIVKPPENTSIAFAEAIAGLYLSKKDNKVVADKIITYFNEHVRTKYFLNIHVHDETYADVLSRKSAVPIEITNQLAAAIKNANSSAKVSDEELLLLNGLVEKFFKNKS